MTDLNSASGVWDEVSAGNCIGSSIEEVISIAAALWPNLTNTSSTVFITVTFIRCKHTHWIEQVLFYIEQSKQDMFSDRNGYHFSPIFSRGDYRLFLSDAAQTFTLLIGSCSLLGPFTLCLCVCIEVYNHSVKMSHTLLISCIPTSAANVMFWENQNAMRMVCCYIILLMISSSLSFKRICNYKWCNCYLLCLLQRRLHDLDIYRHCVYLKKAQVVTTQILVLRNNFSNYK